jgi:hypothetical protein
MIAEISENQVNTNSNRKGMSSHLGAHVGGQEVEALSSIYSGPTE